MPSFPQLSSGSCAQYPIVKHLKTRTIVNELENGSSVRFAESGASSVEWRLHLSALTAEEWSAIQALFVACEGRLGNFLFLDPTSNLLLWSEDLSSPLWIKDPLLRVTPAIEDGFGTQRASLITNIGQATQRLAQTISGPGGFQYCFSVYLRSAQLSQVSLSRSTTTVTESVDTQVSPDWNRFVSSGKLPSSDDSITVAIELPPGESIEVFGLQLEAQLAPSPYKQTTKQGGVHLEARFADDTLPFTAEAVEQTSAVLRIFSQVEG